MSWRLPFFFGALVLAAFASACGDVVETPPTGGPPNGVCYPDQCNDTQLDVLFGRVAEELANEGSPVTRRIWTEPVYYTAVFVRLNDRVGQGTSTGTVAPSSTDTWCGPAQFVPMAAQLVHPGDCMNEVCRAHHDCYTTTASVALGCAFSPQSGACDDAFFDGYDGCVGADRCGQRCRITAALARGIAAQEAEPTCR